MAERREAEASSRAEEAPTGWHRPLFVNGVHGGAGRFGEQSAGGGGDTTVKRRSRKQKRHYPEAGGSIPSPPVMDALNPDAATLIALGSVARHAEELLSPGGHAFDREAIKGLLEQPNVQEWMKAADALALLPVKRTDREAGG